MIINAQIGTYVKRTPDRKGIEYTKPIMGMVDTEKQDKVYRQFAHSIFDLVMDKLIERDKECDSDCRT